MLLIQSMHHTVLICYYYRYIDYNSLSSIIPYHGLIDFFAIQKADLCIQQHILHHNYI